jgi:signal transduction histidine kinase
MMDKRIPQYVKAALSMKEGQFDVELPVEGNDDVARLGSALKDLARVLESRFEEVRTLSAITTQVNAGLILDEILNHVFETFRPIIPYNRIGFSLLEENGTVVRARWARSDAPVMEITGGYSARLQGSSLQQIIETRKPRILNDLEVYLNEHPASDSTQRVVKEGMRSSLTCPLVAMNKPIGFMFFSSMKPYTYEKVHTELFRQIAGQLATIVEKGRLYQQLVELNELKNKFLGMAAHDLRNPLSAIKGLLELTLEGSFGTLGVEQREMLTEVSKASDGMLILVNDLLDVSAIESGHVTLHVNPHHIEEIIELCVKSNRMFAAPKSIELTTDLPPKLPLVSVDPDRIKQVINNLVSNAIKYSLPITTVKVTARVAGNELHVAVIDQGQGIPKGELDRLFKDFSRTSVRPTGNERSTGLGLAIARRMVEAHGGSIWVDSSVGTGSTFTFSLPLSLL